MSNSELIEAAAWPHGHPRVLQVVPALERGGGGVERSAIDVAAVLAASDVEAFVASSGGDMLRELGRAHVAHLTLPLTSRNPFTLWRNARRLTRAITELKIDIVHASARGPAWSAYHAAKRTGAHFVTTVHGAYALTGPLKRRYNAIMTRGERVIANSHFIANYLQSHYRIAPERLRVIPRGIDLKRYDPARVSAERVIRLARAWRLPDGQPVVMLPARMTRSKGHAVLIEAMARLGRENIVCLLVGAVGESQRYRDRLVRLAAKRGLGARLMLVDHCDDMPAAYMLADVVVSASVRPESFGRTVSEAQAMGRPVVVSDHGGAREQILPGQTGWAYPPQDPNALATALAQALALNGEARLRLAAIAREHVRMNYDVARMVALTCAVYEELAPGQ
ncbi:MAG: glycosyltransferase [Alphaproteobacteria bacterium]|nr:glycosyltransferase [Alphaproteobacteria bacterium]